MQNKRGSAHFEMIVSFVFFISFISFLFLTIQPYQDSTISESTNQGLFNGIKNYAGVELMETFIKINVSSGGSSEKCAGLELENRAFEYPLTNGAAVSLEGETEEAGLNFNELGTGRSLFGLTLQSESLDRDSYHKLFISSEFLVNSVNLTECPQDPIRVLGPITSRKVMGYSKMQQLKNEYEIRYDELKGDLGVPKVREFAITFDEFPELGMERFLPDNRDVIVKSKQIEVLKSDGSITISRVITKVW